MPDYITDSLVTDRKCLFEFEPGVALVLSGNSLYSTAAVVFEVNSLSSVATQVAAINIPRLP